MDFASMGFKIAVIARAFHQKMDLRTSELDLTPSQLRILGDIQFLECAGVKEIYQRDLEHRAHVSHPTMTGIIQRLEHKGFITCTPSSTDRRYKKIRSTEKSMGLHRLLRQEDKAVFQEICSGLSQAQMDEFAHLVNRIFQNIPIKY